MDMGGGKWGLGNKSEVRSVGGRTEGRGGVCVCERDLLCENSGLDVAYICSVNRFCSLGFANVFLMKTRLVKDGNVYLLSTNAFLL